MKKGIDILTDHLAFDSCPHEYGLTDVKRQEDKTLRSACIYGSTKHIGMCQECFKQAINLEYESEADNE